MAFIGNDIVDLTDPGNIGKSGDNRFLQRVFTIPERERIAAAGDPDAMMWMLWSVKETAYKVVRKIDPLAASTPRLYPVLLSPGDHGPIRSGMVHTPKGPVVIRVSVAGEYLHCIGAAPLPDILDHVLWSVDRLTPAGGGGDHSPSTAVRRHARLRLAALLHASAADIAIRRCQDIHGWGPPQPYLNEKPAPFDLSFSHDGAFVAYAMIPTGAG
ncbi:MAG: 4'-phosphopantetheinyl transferase superfamily protein [Pseudomonadota bacterium]